MTQTHPPPFTPAQEAAYRLYLRRTLQTSAEPVLGEPFAAWKHRLVHLPMPQGRLAWTALDVMVLQLCSVPAVSLPAGLVRTAWHHLTPLDPATSLGEDTFLLQTLAETDAGPLLPDDTFLQALSAAQRTHLDVLTALIVGHTPHAVPVVVDSAAISLGALVHAVEQGLLVAQATPEAQTTYTQLLLSTYWMTQDDGKNHADTPGHPAQVAGMALATCIRLRFLPQLLPGPTDLRLTLTYAAICWRLGRDRWRGSETWQRQLRVIREDLKAYARGQIDKRYLRPLEPSGFLPMEADLEIIGKANASIEMLVALSQEDLLDLEPAMLSLPNTPAGRLAQKLAFLDVAAQGPRRRWGPNMRQLQTQLHLEDPSETFFHLAAKGDALSEQLVVELHEGARAAHLLAVTSDHTEDTLAACTPALAHLRAAHRAGAPVGTLVFELETALKHLWNALDRPLSPWLYARAGPVHQERVAWQDQLTALLQTATTQLQPEAVAAPEPSSDLLDDCPSITPLPLDSEEAVGSVFAHSPLSLTETKVLAALKGRTLVLLGGELRPYARAALIRDLELDDVDWISSSEYDHGQQAVSRLRDPNIAAVVFALRWAGHAHNTIRDAAWSLGLPAINLPGGYNPRQVLHQLTQQASHTLLADPPTAQ
ncbi:hypothetical protein [Deinococcus ruber]|uniref:hypothetical protein n=1 Tax=Deinococcus ruber TaxID=1848197 RepID=UPI0016640E28|nr:hypothetical protein [Deinococcus ruber]